MRNRFLYVCLLPFLYALVSMPLQNGSWQEYLLLGASTGLLITTYFLEPSKEVVPVYRTVLVHLFILAVYAAIFYWVSDWSLLEAISFGVLCLPAIIDIGQLVVLRKR